MSLSSVPYFFATCSGKTGNLRTPKCLIEGPGSFDEADATDQATAAGWVLGPKSYCPAHRDQAPATSAEAAPAPARRRRKSAQEETILETPEEQNV